MGLLLVLAALVAGVPVATYALCLGENIRSGQLPRVRALCGGRLLVPVLRAVCNSAWSIVLVVLAYPFGWLPPDPQQSPPPSAPAGLPPVLLVHGLYHNASAWFLFRRRLRRAGFDAVRSYAYASFFKPYAAIAEGLAQAVLRVAEASPTGTVLLVGHSLGGLLIRSVCVRAELRGRVAGILTIGTPHQGSRLAGLLALGRLGRGLRPGGGVLEAVRALPVCPGPALSLYSPLDNMVLPLSGSLLEEREKSAGWTEESVPPVSHVGMLFDRRVAGRGVEFLRWAASRPASP
ncbi:MAG: esterase/lipase family protein [Humidesulfovibrio sp.]